MKRNRYSMSHLSHRAGHIGRIQTLSIIPMEAGASIELTYDAIARLASPRKEIVSECQWDVCAFFVKHRTIYGQPFVDFLKASVNETTTFTGIDVAAPYRAAPYLTINQTQATLNKALVEGYNRIFYNYYSVPGYPYNHDNALDNLQFDWFPTVEAGADNCRKYGRLAARLPHVMNGGTNVNAHGIAAWAPQTVASNQVYSGSGVLSTTDIAQIAARYKTTQENAYLEHFYQDIIKSKFGGHASKDADVENQRPEFWMRETGMLSGHDVDGTDDATLGSYQGKTVGRIGMHLPRKVAGEHGFLWIMLLLRYPLVHNFETHPLLQQVNWSYADIAGDANIIAKLPPEHWDISPWLTPNVVTPAPSTSILQPYGQHYRFQNNIVHEAYYDIPGYPFTSTGGSDVRDWYYYVDNEYYPTFMTPQIGQWQTQGQFTGTKFSHVPGVMSSIMAGTHVG